MALEKQPYHILEVFEKKIKLITNNLSFLLKAPVTITDTPLLQSCQLGPEKTILERFVHNTV